MRPTLALRDESWGEIIALLELDVETAGFVLAGVASDEDELTLLGRSVGWVPEEHYRERTATTLDIASRGYYPFLGAAASDQAVPIFVHTHPQMSAKPSPRDDQVDEALQRRTFLRTDAPFHVSLIVGGTKEQPTFTGRIYDRDGRVRQLERLRVVGRRFHVFLAEKTPDAEIDAEIYGRQILAFGHDGQRVLSRLRVGIVGAGGTGSAVFEQLVRSGARDIVVIDNDTLTEANVTRVHESAIADKQTAKVLLMEAAAKRIGLGTRVRPIKGRLIPENVRELRHLDVVFGCTDDELGRLVLSKLALTHLVQVYDMAVAVDPNPDGTIRGITGRVTLLLPGEACLLCRERISSLGIAADELDPEERRRRAEEGYVPGLEEEPSVGTFTTLVASFAMNEFLDRLYGYSEPETTFQSSELLIHLANRRISYSSRLAKPTHWCGNPDNYGRGDAHQL